MKFTPLAIPDILLIEPKVYADARGFFYESYHRALFEKHGIREAFVQDNHSRSQRGVLRGLHYQIEPYAQAKLVRVTRGRVFDAVVDIRKHSKSFGKYVTHVLSAEKKEMIYIPKGFAHGFCVLEDDTEFLYKVSHFYSAAHERGILWNDPALAIPWPKLDAEFILSEKDQKFPRLEQARAQDA